MMDTKEALKELEDLTVDYGDRNEEQIARLDEAIDMAMDALRNLPNRLRQAMDTISRQSAVEACYNGWNKDYREIAQDIKDLPPAQPKKRTEERTETHACDLISRQAAIDALGEEPKYKVRIIKTYAEGRNDQWFDDVAKLSLLPSAQPNLQPTCNLASNDCISRQAAIDAMAKFVPYAIDDDVTRAYTDGLTDAYNLVCQLPSAQPEVLACGEGELIAQPEIIHCGECKHRDPEDHKCDCGHDIIWQLPRDDKWYCADAERKDGEADEAD